MDDKRQLVRNYILCLIGEGTFKDVQSPLAVIAKAGAVFAKDAASVIGEMTTQFAEVHGPKMQAAAIESVHDFIGNAFKVGLRSAWEDLKTQHKRGMEANARRKS